MKLHTLRNTAMALVLGLGLLVPIVGAAAVYGPERHLEEALAPDLFETNFRNAAKSDKVGVEFGGWTGISVAGFTNEDKDRTNTDAVSSILLHDLRLFSRVWFRDGSTAYVRLRALGYDFGTVAGLPDPNLPYEGIDLDLGYVDTKLFWGTPIIGGEYRIGRQFIQYGSGIVLANTLDAVRTYSQRGNFTYNTFFGKNKPRELDIDQNITSPHRIFTGWDGAYQRHDGHKLFGYVLAERDKSRQPAGTTPLTQGFHYDANYVGFGSDGRIHPLVDYHIEGIYQNGESYSIGTGTVKNDINASAGIAKLTHHNDRRMHPTYSAEYAYASGDPGRLPGSSTVSGSAPGADDGSFLAFGRYDLGIALNPRLANLKAFRLGGTIRPWEENEGFEQLTLGGKLSWYSKSDAAGGITDPVATAPSDDLGTGLDLFMGWRIMSDLSWLVQYGLFNPGEAYPVATRDSTKVFYSNVTWSF